MPTNSIGLASHCAIKNLADSVMPTNHAELNVATVSSITAKMKYVQKRLAQERPSVQNLSFRLGFRYNRRNPF